MSTAERFQESIYVKSHLESVVIKKVSFEGIVGLSRRQVFTGICGEKNISTGSSHPSQSIFGEKGSNSFKRCQGYYLGPQLRVCSRRRLGMAEAAGEFSFTCTGCPVEVADSRRCSSGS